MLNQNAQNECFYPVANVSSMKMNFLQIVPGYNEYVHGRDTCICLSNQVHGKESLEIR
jgi:hypothetical protein